MNPQLTNPGVSVRTIMSTSMAFFGLFLAAQAHALNQELCASRLPPGSQEPYIADSHVSLSYAEISGDTGVGPIDLGARVAGSYDSAGLYLILDVRDPTPLVNAADAGQARDHALSGDSVLVGLRAPGQVPVQVLAYYHSGLRKAVVRVWKAENSISGPYESIRELRIDSVSARFRMGKGGQSYLAQIDIPWNLLDATLPISRLDFTLDVFWGGPDAHPEDRAHLHDFVNDLNPSGRFRWMNPRRWGALSLDCMQPTLGNAVHTTSPVERLHALRYSTEGAIPIRYRLDQDGFVTLVIDSMDGGRVRNLIADYPRKAGWNTDYWDGMDDDGHPMENGSYRMRGIVHEGLGASYEFSFGSPGAPPWPTKDGRGAWLANHTNPIAVAADRERIYVAAEFSEGPHTLIALDYDGKKLWGALERAHAGPMALSGGYLYVIAEEGNTPARTRAELSEPVQVRLRRLDPETGKRVPLGRDINGVIVANWIPGKTGVSRGWPGKATHDGYTGDWTGSGVLGMVAHAGSLYIPLRYENRILRVNPESGSVTGRIDVTKPGGLAVQGNSLLVVSDNKVVRVDPVTGDQAVLIGAGLSAPVAIAVDEKGFIYVADWMDRMQIRVYSASGEYLRDIGRKGGRLHAGPYRRDSLMLPRGIALDAEQRLWVAEDCAAPRRVSVWDREGGLIDEMLGGLNYGGVGAFVIPDEPKRAIVMGTLVELDWKTGGWRVLDTLWRADDPRSLVGLRHDARIGDLVRNEHGDFIVHTTERGGATVLSRLDETSGRAVPVAAAGAVVQLISESDARIRGAMDIPPVLARNLWSSERVNSSAMRILKDFIQGAKAGSLEALYGGAREAVSAARSRSSSIYPDANFIWSDINGNGYLDTDEVQFHPSPSGHGGNAPAWRASRWSRGVTDGDLGFYFTVSRGDDMVEHWRLPVSEWTDDGVPVYRSDDAELVAASRNKGYVVWSDPGNGDFLSIADTPGSREDGMTDPITMFHRDGYVAWTYPSLYSGIHASHSAPKPAPGLLIGTLGVLGTADVDDVGGIFAVHTNMGEAVFFTRDGLYIDSVFQDVRTASSSFPERPNRGDRLDGVTNGGEWFGGQLFQRGDDRQVYVVMGRRAGNIAKISGLESLRRLPDQVITVRDGSLVGSVAAREAATGDRAALSIIPLPENASGLEDMERQWRSPFVDFSFDDHHRAEASWSWDDDHLYVIFRGVGDLTPMRNIGDDAMQLFKPGDAALFELGTRPGRNNARAGDGDIRILFSVFHGEAVAILYRYDDLAGGADMKFTSPTGMTEAKVTRLTDARIRIERHDGGYDLTAAIPLGDLGFRPVIGKTYRGDFGVVYSDPAGTDNMLRMFWANSRGGLVSDLAAEANVAPAEWGYFHTGNVKGRP